MGSLTLSIAGGTSISKTVLIYSNTTSEQLFTATWLIGDSLFSDTPTSETDWTAFKSTYVTVGTGDNNINVDLAQWAADNGSVAGGALHSYTITSFCNSAECQSDLNSYTIEVEAAIPLPSVPQNFTAIAGDGEVTTGWSAAANATSYVIAYKLATDTLFTEVITTNLSESIESLTNGLEYLFKVKSRNATGDSAYTAIRKATPVASTSLPSVPTGLVIEGVLFGVETAWSSASGATSYVLSHERTDGTGTATEIVITSTTHDILGTLINDKEYDFKVKSRNSDGDSAFSSVVTIKPFDYRETGAERHYVFGDDNLSYLDIDGANGATKLGTGHTQLSGYVSTLKVGALPYLNGIQSNVVDKATQQTLIIVGQMYSDVDGAIVMGNISTSSGQGGISTLQQHTGTRTGDFFIDSRGTVPFHYIEDTANPSAQIPIHNGWFFFAHSLNSTGRKTFYQDSTMSSPVIQNETGTVDLSSPVRALGWGNVAYNQSARKHGMKIAEGMIFQTGKTDAEISAIYARSVARLGLRGITV